MPVVNRKFLTQASSGGCHDCGHKDHEMVLAPQCHVNAGCSLNLSDRGLIVSCGKCDKYIVEVGLEATPTYLKPKCHENSPIIVSFSSEDGHLKTKCGACKDSIWSIPVRC